MRCIASSFTDSYALALLDIMLPGKDGFELLGELKEHRIPVIYLTAKGDLPSKVKGLRSGAEDYIVKPFEMLELLARMDNILKRCGKVEAEEICIRDVVINEKKRTVHKNGVEISMQPMEFDCLLVFWKYRNRVITRDQILNALFTWFLLLLMVTRMSHARIYLSFSFQESIIILV